MGRPLLLDMFCKAGGASMGYDLAGFEVVGVDIEPQPNYPFAFHQGDALEFYAAYGHMFDAIAASPPCQSESTLRHRTGREYTDWLTPTLAALADETRPWVVENVASTDKLPGSLVLCGTEFGLRAGGYWLKRHRRFGSNRWLMAAGGCQCAGKPIGGVYGGGPQTTGGRFKWDAAGRRAVMGIDWMTRDELAQAIPPAYTQFIGEQLLEHLAVARG